MVTIRILRVRRAGVPISWADLFGMALRGGLDSDLTNALIDNHRAKLGINVMDLEAHRLAGGSSDDVIRALVVVRHISPPASFLQMAALDLAGYPVVELAGTYMKLLDDHPYLEFSELANRAVKGEDVIAAAAAGRFEPTPPEDS